MSDSVRVRREPPLRFVELDSGPRNLLQVAVVEELAAALAPDEEAPVAILSGRADGFCAGLDGRVLAGEARERDELLARMGELLVEILASPTRVVAVCEGHAVAAGAMLLLVSDLRFGVPGRYKVGFTEPRIGMPLPELPALLARERVDRRRLHELTALGRVVGPEDAAAFGFLDALHAPDAVYGVAREQAASLAELTEPVYRASLRAMWGPTLARLRELAGEARARAEASKD